MKKTLKKYKFSICADGAPVYEGYTLGDTWNGWECPYFTKEVGEEMINFLKSYNDSSIAFFYAEKDAFVFEANEIDDFSEEDLKKDFSLCEDLSKKGLVDIFTGTDLIFEDHTIHVYDIGAYNWIWIKE